MIPALFLAARLPLLFLRQPFFDELFTRWISGRSFEGIVDALRFDSGPPLYYWLLHLCGDPPTVMARALSLAFAAVALVVILAAERLGPSRFWAAALIALFPPAVLFAVDARAYALCAMFVTIGVVALRYDRPMLAAAMFALAGYSHYYGALFLVLLVPHLRALAAGAVMILPAVWLALHQPRAAIGWMQPFAYPDALFVRPPLLLAAALALLLVAAALRADRYAVMTLVPLALALALGVYVPLRFEAVVAAPLALWLAPARRAVVIPLAAAMAIWTALGAIDHARRPPDEYRAAATWLARHAPAGETVVASGYLYLETISQRPAIAFPPEQGEHPGWRAAAPLTSSAGLPRGGFLWIAERGAPERAVVLRGRAFARQYANARAEVLRVGVENELSRPSP